MIMELDPEFCQQADEVQDLVFEEVFPILVNIDESYPEQSAFFTMFISSLYVLFNEGWTKEDLLREIEDHHTIHLNTENPANLH